MTRTARLRVEPLEDRATPSSGQLDPSFDGDGVARTGLRNGGLALAPDGGVVYASSVPATTGPTAFVPALSRLNPNGTPDTSYGNVALPSAGRVSTLADGRAFAAGLTTASDVLQQQLTVTRVTQTGTPDTTFGTNGTAVVGATGYEYGQPLVLGTPDGGAFVVVSRTTRTQDGTPAPQPAQVVVAYRLTAAGVLAPSFGTGGEVVVAQLSGDGTRGLPVAAAVTPDYNLILAGGQTPAAVRLMLSGDVFPTFGAGGRVNLPVSAPFEVRSVEVFRGNRVMIAGGSAGVGVALKLNENGTLDTTYGNGGRAEIPVTGDVYAADVDTRGRVVFTAATFNRGFIYSDQSVYRLTDGGAIDTRFGANGRVALSSLPNGERADFFSGVVVQPNGDIVADGSLLDGTRTIVRLLGREAAGGFVSPVAGAFVAGGSPDGTVQVLNPVNGTYAASAPVTAYAGFTGSVRSVVADVTGDGTPDLVTGAGPGGPPAVTVFDGKTGLAVADFLAFEPTFTGGVFVGVLGNGDIVVTPDEGGGPRVVAFSVAADGAVTPRTSFFAFNDPNFRGGARVAVGDVNGDGGADVIVAAGFQGGPRVVVYDGVTLYLPDEVIPIAGGNPPLIIARRVKLVGDFFAFPGDAATLRNGVFVAASDLNADGKADLIFGGGPGGAPRVFTISGALLTTRGPDVAQASPLSNFFVGGNAADRGGVTVAATGGSVAVGSGRGNAGRVRVYNGADFLSPAEPTAFQDVSVFGGATLPGGVFVG